MGYVIGQTKTVIPPPCFEIIFTFIYSKYIKAFCQQFVFVYVLVW